MTIGLAAATVAALMALLAAPLVLGTYLVVQGLDQRWHAVWFWSLAGLLLTSFFLSSIGVVALLVAG